MALYLKVHRRATMVDTVAEAVDFVKTNSSKFAARAVLSNGGSLVYIDPKTHRVSYPDGRELRKEEWASFEPGTYAKVKR